MAGDWIPIREDIHEDPAVLKIARKLKTRPEHVVGYLVRFWAWASRNTADGVIEGVTPDDIETVLHLPHFLGMLQNVGWLEFHEEVTGPKIIIPNFERWLSTSAKQRVQATRRKQKQRVTDMSRSDRDENVTTEEKRKEENSTVHSTVLNLDPENLFFEDAKRRASEIVRALGGTLGNRSNRTHAWRAAWLVASGNYSENWLHDSIAATKAKAPSNPWPYFYKCLVNKAKEQDRDFKTDAKACPRAPAAES